MLRALIDFTLSNARRFYSSMGNLLDGKGLTTSKTMSLLKSITEVTRETVKPQPLATDIKTAILLFPGPLVTYLAIKKYGARAMRSVARPELKLVQLT